MSSSYVHILCFKVSEVKLYFSVEIFEILLDKSKDKELLFQLSFYGCSFSSETKQSFTGVSRERLALKPLSTIGKIIRIETKFMTSRHATKSEDIVYHCTLTIHHSFGRVVKIHALWTTVVVPVHCTGWQTSKNTIHF